MSLVAIRAALETALDALTPALVTAWENKPFDPQTAVAAGAPYQRATLLPAQPRNDENGARYMEQGIFQVALLYPLKGGAGVATARAEAIRAAFPRGRTLTSGGVAVTIDRTPEIGPGLVEDDRYLIPVRVRWYAPVEG